MTFKHHKSAFKSLALEGTFRIIFFSFWCVFCNFLSCTRIECFRSCYYYVCLRYPSYCNVYRSYIVNHNNYVYTKSHPGIAGIYGDSDSIKKKIRFVHQLPTGKNNTIFTVNKCQMAPFDYIFELDIYRYSISLFVRGLVTLMCIFMHTKFCGIIQKTNDA